MLLVDYHMHSCASFDAQDTMKDMAHAAARRGVTDICFTDHIDLDDPRTGEYDEAHWSKWPEILRQYREAQGDCPSGMNIKLGIELSSIQHRLDIAKKRAAQEELDFIIGSIHNTSGMPDYYFLRYTSAEQCISLLRDYMREHLELAESGLFDVIGHIGYTKRYMLHAGFDIEVNTKTFGDELRALFKTLIERGKGLELNCSGFRRPGIAGPIPSFDVLKLYHDMGGEIITVGSDAHKTGDAGRDIREGVRLLYEAGFRYITLFDRRKPVFKKIS